MKRRLLNLLTLLSLLLCVAAAAMWVRSNGCRDNLWLCGGAGGRLWWLESAEGRVALRTAAGWPAAVPPRATSSPASTDLKTLVFDGRRPLVFLRDNPQRSLGVAVGEWRARHAGLLLRRGNVVTLRPDQSYTPPMRYFELVCTHWLLASLGVLPAVAWVVASVGLRRRRSRAANALCPACGYDLRATPERCPECGAAGVVRSRQ